MQRVRVRVGLLWQWRRASGLRAWQLKALALPRARFMLGRLDFNRRKKHGRILLRARCLTGPRIFAVGRRTALFFQHAGITVGANCKPGTPHMCAAMSSEGILTTLSAYK